MIDFGELKSRALDAYDTSIEELGPDEELAARVRKTIEDAEDLGGLRLALHICKHALLVEASTEGHSMPFPFYEVCACAERAVGHAYCVCVAEEEKEVAEEEDEAEAEKEVAEDDDDVIDADLVDAALVEPWDGYDELNASGAVDGIEGMDDEELEHVRAYEAAHKNRKTVLRAIDAKLEG